MSHEFDLHGVPAVGLHATGRVLQGAGGEIRVDMLVDAIRIDGEMRPGILSLEMPDRVFRGRTLGRVPDDPPRPTQVAARMMAGRPAGIGIDGHWIAPPRGSPSDGRRSENP